MSKKKVELQLLPCCYCGGKGELKTKRASANLTIGHGIKASMSKRFIRCSKCHARTQAFGKIINCVNHWNTGQVYKHYA